MLSEESRHPDVAGDRGSEPPVILSNPTADPQAGNYDSFSAEPLEVIADLLDYAQQPFPLALPARLWREPAEGSKDKPRLSF